MTFRTRMAAAFGLLTAAVATFAQTPASAPRAAPEGYATIPGAQLFYVDTGGDGIPVPTYRAANPEGTRRWAEIESQSRPSLPRTSTCPTQDTLFTGKIRSCSIAPFSNSFGNTNC